MHSPATDPVANSTPEPPIRHDLAVGSSHETSAAPANLPSARNGSSPPQIYGNETATMLSDQTKVIKALRCEVCKIEANSKDTYEQHIAGKKHKKNLQVQTNPTIASHADLQTDTGSIQGQALIGPVADQSEPKKQVDSFKVCSTCNVLCTSPDAYNNHVAGRKHAAKVALMSNDQSTWCEVCKISCTSRDVYITHLVGKKHLKNLKKLSDPKIDVDTGATITATATNTLIGSQEKPDSGATATVANTLIGPEEKPDSGATATTANTLIGPEENPDSGATATVANTLIGPEEKPDSGATATAANTLIGPEEKPDSGATATAANTLIGPEEKPDSGATATAASTLIEPEEKPDSDKPKPKKKRKVVEGGAAFDDGFKMCTLCSVLCNSQTVFDSHLIGHKHTAMVKKAGSITG